MTLGDRPAGKGKADLLVTPSCSICGDPYASFGVGKAWRGEPTRWFCHAHVPPCEPRAPGMIPYRTLDSDYDGWWKAPVEGWADGWLRMTDANTEREVTILLPRRQAAE